MPLTPTEKALCRDAAAMQHLRGHGWGSPATGACPIGAVVVHRGGTLFLHRSGAYSLLPEPPPGRRMVVLHQCDAATQVQYHALASLAAAVEAEVLAWTGFATVGALTTALMAHGAAALPEE